MRRHRPGRSSSTVVLRRGAARGGAARSAGAGSLAGVGSGSGSGATARSGSGSGASGVGATACAGSGRGRVTDVASGVAATATVTSSAERMAAVLTIGSGSTGRRVGAGAGEGSTWASSRTGPSGSSQALGTSSGGAARWRTRGVVAGWSTSLNVIRMTAAHATPTTTRQTTIVNTVSESVPSATEEPGGTRGWWRWWYTVPLVVFALCGVGASTVKIPYYAISPGSAIDVSGLVEVVDAPSFEPEGQIFLTTVRLRQVTLLEAITGWLDPAVDVVEQAIVLPPTVPSAELRDFNLQLMDTSKQTALGVALRQLGIDTIRGDGAEVVTVLDGTPAAGLLEPGDLIVAVADDAIDLHDEVVSLLRSRRPGEVVTLTVEPDGGGDRREVEVTLAARDDAPGRGFLGVTLRTRELRFEFPFVVNIASDRIGGPSAGLAFTLEVLDVLTEGELTGGRRIAATGTIELDGSVGSVGGVGQKTVAVQRQGVELFLVPSDSYELALRFADDGLQVEAVDTLDDALRILEAFGGDRLTAELGGADQT
jgi:Lon-like protease